MERSREDGIAGEIITLAAGSLYALVNPVELDGRLSWYPYGLRGFAPITCYLLIDGDEALLVDTGVTVHRASLIAQLRELVGPETRLRILHTRLGEYGSICNTTAIVAEFPTSTVYGTFSADDWVDFEPPGALEGDRSRLWHGVSFETLGPEQTIVLGGGRPVLVFASPLRLLPTHWLYDEATGFLLTSDSFSHLVGDLPDGPWTTSAREPETTLAELRAHLAASRYWWLAEADTEPIRELLRERLTGLRPAGIGPAYGRILDSGSTVEHEWALLDRILSEPPRDDETPSGAATP